MTRVGLLQPRLERGRRGDRRGCAQLGHRVGLHAVYPNARARRALRPGRRLAQPRPGVHDARRSRARSTSWSEPYFDPATYRSDSNQRWRSGDPHEELRAGAFPWLQLLTHPEIWAYPGETMGETMRAMLEAEKERRLDSSPRTGSTCRERAPGTIRPARGPARRRRRPRRRERRRPRRRHGPAAGRPAHAARARAAPPLRGGGLRRSATRARDRRAGSRGPLLRRGGRQPRLRSRAATTSSPSSAPSARLHDAQELPAARGAHGSGWSAPATARSSATTTSSGRT